MISKNLAKLLSISCLLASPLAFATGTDACSSVAGAYVSKANYATIDADSGVSSVRNSLVVINDDKTIFIYNSNLLDQPAKVGTETQPSMGTWKCSNGVLKATLLDYFTLAKDNTGAFGTEFWYKADPTVPNDPKLGKIKGEFTRITLKIDFNSNPILVKQGLVGVDASINNKLGPNTFDAVQLFNPALSDSTCNGNASLCAIRSALSGLRTFNLVKIPVVDDINNYNPPSPPLVFP